MSILQGRRLLTCCNDKDFRITVDGEVCDIYYRDSTTIYCIPPEEGLSDNGNVQVVIVSIG